MKFVIVGLGSIGQRHQKNLVDLGHETITCHRSDNLKQILKLHRPDGVFICNPTSLHLSAAMIAAEAGQHIFLEKPVSHNLKGIDKLIQKIRQKKMVIQVGYNLRFEPKLRELKKASFKIGRIQEMTIVAASYLPDWRPETDYRQNYAAKKELGGGVLLDLSHEIDYAVWLLGKVKKVKAKLQKSDKLEMETEAIADLILNHDSGVTSQIHLDYVTKGYIRNCQIMGSKENLSWDFARIKDSDWDFNEMYLDEIKHFIKAIKGKVEPTPTIEEGRHVVEICKAAKESSKSNQTIEL